MGNKKMLKYGNDISISIVYTQLVLWKPQAVLYIANEWYTCTIYLACS